MGAGPENYAYVLSTILATGQHLFNFDPRVISTGPIWAKRTIDSEMANANTYGIIFGSTETVLYTYGYHNGMSKVSRIDTNSKSGSIKWAYGLKGNLTESQAIAHR